MYFLIHFLFHNQNIARPVCFGIVWRRRFDCDVVCNDTIWRSLSLSFLWHLFSLHKRHKILLNQRWRQNNVIYHHCLQFQMTVCCFVMLDEWMFDLLTFLICIVMKLFCKFILFLWNCVMNAGKVLMCDKYIYIYNI
jgi:hypothetical protein